MRDLRVRARVTADTADATRNIGGLRGAFSGLTEFLRSRFVITLGDVTRALSAGVAAIGSFITAAGQQQDAVNALDASLRRLGPAADEVSERLQAQASALQQVTRFGDEAIIAQQALVSNLGLTAEQIELVSQAAVDLAAGTGRGLEFAFINLARTFSGTSGELSELIPALRDLTAEQLRAGEGARVVAEQFSGAAAADADTFRGVIQQLSNAFGDLQEQLGNAIVENEDVNRSLQELRDTVSSPEFQAGVETLADAFGALASSAVQVGAELPGAAASIRDTFSGAASILESFGISVENTNQSSERFLDVAGRLLAVDNPLVNLFLRLGSANRELAQSQREVERGAAELAARQQEVTVATEQRIEVEDRLTRILREQDEAQTDLNDALSNAGVSVTVASEEIAKLETALSEAEEAFRSGAIGAERYEATVSAINEKLEQFAPMTSEAARATRELNQEFVAAEQGARELTNEIDRSTQALDRQAAASARSGASLASSLGLRATTGSNQGRLEAALAAGIRPTLGGTRIRTTDGGSILLGR